MNEKKELDQELDQISGGRREEILKRLYERIPIRLQSKLAKVNSDVEFCKILADNGIDVEKLQKTLPDDVLDKVGGGYENIFGTEIYCPNCGNHDSDEISLQIFATLTSGSTKYRCRKCDKYFKMDASGHVCPII